MLEPELKAKLTFLANTVSLSKERLDNVGRTSVVDDLGADVKTLAKALLNLTVLITSGAVQMGSDVKPL